MIVQEETLFLRHDLQRLASSRPSPFFVIYVAAGCSYRTLSRVTSFLSPTPQAFKVVFLEAKEVNRALIAYIQA